MDPNSLSNQEKILLYVKHMLHDIKNNPEISMLRISNREEYKNRMIKKYGQLRAKSESLFNLIVGSGDVDMVKLRQMLELIRKVECDEASYEDASVAWGRVNFDQYVKPITDNLPVSEDAESDINGSRA